MDMSGKKFSAGLLAGSLLTIAVLAVGAIITLNANAAMRTSMSELDRRAVLTSDNGELPELGEVTFKGLIETINADSYLVSGLTFRFDLQTVIDAGLAVGDAVEVKALMLPDQTRYALSIQLEESFDALVGATFEFHGLVESTGSPNWVISGEVVQVDLNTVVDSNVAIGSLVEVKGLVVGGNLVAGKIELEDDSSDSSGEMDEVEFSGVIESITNGTYVIDGKIVVTDLSTEIKDMLAVGDFVKVHATLQTDGTYLAREIEKEDDEDQDDFEEKDGKLEFTGVLESISGSTWVIDGIAVMVDMNTEVEGNPQPGDQVKVEAFLQVDGVTYLAHEIKALDNGDDMDDDDQNDDQDEDQDEDQDDDEDNDDDQDDDENDHDDHGDDENEDDGQGDDSED